MVLMDWRIDGFMDLWINELMDLLIDELMDGRRPWYLPIYLLIPKRLFQKFKQKR